MVIVLAHWAEHLLQAFQIYGLGWPVPQARGALGYFFPYLVTSEMLHYGYALVMLAGLWMLRPGFTGDERSQVVDHRAVDPVLPSHRALPAAGAVPARSEPVRQAGADQHRAAVGAARRAAPVLQHHRLHPDDGRDVLTTCSRRRPRQGSSSARARGTAGSAPAPDGARSSFSLQPRAGCAQPVLGLDVHRGHRSRDAISIAWTLDPSPPVVGTPIVARITLRDARAETGHRRAPAARRAHVPSRAWRRSSPT